MSAALVRRVTAAIERTTWAMSSEWLTGKMPSVTAKNERLAEAAIAAVREWDSMQAQAGETPEAVDG